MAKEKKSFIAYSDWKNTFDSLPDDIAGKLIKHIFAYVNDENPTTDDFMVNALFQQIKSTLKRDLDKWEKQKEQRSLAGKKSAKQRALTKSNERSTKSNERSTSVNETQRNSTVNVNVNGNVSVNDNVKDNIKENNTIAQVEKSTSTETSFDKFSNETKSVYKEVYELFPKKYRAKNNTEHLKHLKIIKACLKDYQPKDLIRIIKFARTDDFWKSNTLSIGGLRNKKNDVMKIDNISAKCTVVSEPIKKMKLE